MGNRKKFWLAIFFLVVGVSLIPAGDVATFVDLGFSPDGRIYMFGQYGIHAKTLKPWADLLVVDVPQNRFVSGGRFSYTHDRPAIAGQDGSGAFFRLISRNVSLADRYDINFLLQGQPLYISFDTPHAATAETIEFRDFEQRASYKATLVPQVEGSGANIRSAFHINLERTGQDGSKKSYVVGNPDFRRPLIASYRIRKVMTAPQDGSLIFVIEMNQLGDDGFDVRYMVEALRL
jgi:predicted secreted protein